jgi:hypothetical protein
LGGWGWKRLAGSSLMISKKLLTYLLDEVTIISPEVGIIIFSDAIDGNSLPIDVYSTGVITGVTG